MMTMLFSTATRRSRNPRTQQNLRRLPCKHLVRTVVLCTWHGRVILPQPISLEQTKADTQGLVATLEAEAASTESRNVTPEAPVTKEEEEEEEEETGGDGEGGGGENEEDEEESDDDIEIIIDQPSRSLDLRPAPNRTASTTTPVRPTPAPSLTTEYTPRERGSLTKLATPQPSSTQSPRPGQIGATSSQTSTDGQQQADSSGPDPSTLPPATAPPSHPSINPAIPGTLDGRSILEVDLSALADKPWRRPGSDLSDWFNYGFDEISWEAYCYRRRELGEVASVLKNNVLNFSGMQEDQLTALPPDLRTMVLAGSTAMMNGGGGGGPGGMMPPGGMNMNGNPMMGQMMNMPMMNPMMQEMGMGMGGMNGDMGMGMGGGPGMPMGMGGAGGGPGMQMGMMQGEGANAGGPGSQVGAGGQPTPEGGMGMGEGFTPGAGGPGQGQGQGMMGMSGGDFVMQDPSGMAQQMSQPGQQMFSGVEGNHTPAPTGTPTPTRGSAPIPGQFRGRGMPPQMPARGRAPYAPRVRGMSRASLMQSVISLSTTYSPRKACLTIASERSHWAAQ
ncbi:Fip1-domain-containing protein [Daedalea quercina L-15889]|uniref:Fip1-domain-containing protein n=1 Tax=Daedalea quercina L-15889 TaxID=1314783 RepID=A0A165TE22_9APHY|nr:Fip1-domain-containing protein [Daedalea quercina L-15889]